MDHPVAWLSLDHLDNDTLGFWSAVLTTLHTRLPTAGQLALAQVNIEICSSAQDRWGKDWNERWQHLGYRGVAPLVEMFSEARSA